MIGVGSNMIAMSEAMLNAAFVKKNIELLMQLPGSDLLYAFAIGWHSNNVVNQAAV